MTDPAKQSAFGLAVLGMAIAPLIAAGFSPLLAWRDPIYIAAGFAGVLCMSLLLIQPLLATGLLLPRSARHRRQLHRGLGVALTLCVIAHVIGLWITSPPDVIDVLLFRSPTPFSIWGALAMWAVFIAALLAVFRRPWRMRLRIWRRAHLGLMSLASVGGVIHALLIEGTMESLSKWALCCAVLAALIWALWWVNRKHP